MLENEKKDVDLAMHLNWDDEINMFIISYLQDSKAVFQIRMSPVSFEKMTEDMIRTVKNYNLFQAQKHQEKTQEIQTELTNEENCNEQVLIETEKTE